MIQQINKYNGFFQALNAFKDSKTMQKIIPMLHSDKKNWGSSLSGGERQLISFARAILQEPKVILLDESTSAMDNDNEAIAYRALKKALPETTLISIAHKESVLKYHQRMFILSNNENKETEVTKKKLGLIL